MIKISVFNKINDNLTVDTFKDQCVKRCGYIVLRRTVNGPISQQDKTVS